MSKFSLFMNMPPQMAKACFTKINTKLFKAYSTVAEQNIQEAGRELHTSLNAENSTSEEIVDCQVSLDGTWQKRGYSSLNGVVSLLSRRQESALTFIFYQ